MSDTENQTVAAPRKFKLRRIKPQQDIIQKNLEPLKQNVQKKKRAQEAYYELHPLLRNSRKGPVHQRLGNKVPFHGTNTSAILPKRRFRLPGTNNFVNNRTRMFSVQNRLNRIRSNRQGLTTQNLSNTKKIRLRRPGPFNRPANLRVQFKNGDINDIANGTNFIKRFKMHLNPELQQEIAKIQQEFQGGQIISPTRIKPVTTNVTTHERFGALQ